LDRYVSAPAIRLVAYCLMPNHFHLLLQLDQDLLSKALQRLTMSYSLATNLRRRRTGPLFTGRFRAVGVKTDDQLAYASAYINLNPLRAALRASAEDWPFSSYRTYLTGKSTVRVDPEPVLSLFRERGPLTSGRLSARRAYRQYVEDLAPGALKLREP
jgi:REP element-mobilizing transposase RayT